MWSLTQTEARIAGADGLCVWLQWRHNKYDGVSHHRRLVCLLNRLFRCKSKKTSKLRVTDLCEGNSPVTGEFPAQRVSNAENASIWWRHHVVRHDGHEFYSHQWGKFVKFKAIHDKETYKKHIMTKHLNAWVKSQPYGIDNKKNMLKTCYDILYTYQSSGDTGRTAWKNILLKNLDI